MSALLHNTFKNIRHDFFRAAMTVVAIAMLVTLFNIVLSLFFGGKYLIDSLTQQATLTVYLQDDIDFTEVNKTIRELEALPEIAPPVAYTTGEDATNAVTGAFSLDTNILEKYNLTLPASLTITLRDHEDFETVKTLLATPPYASKFQNLSKTQEARENKIRQDIARNIGTLNSITMRTIVWVIAIFFVVITLLMSHVLHIHFSSRHEFFALLKMLSGEEKTSAQGPLIVEGMTYAACGVLLSIPLFFITLPIALQKNTSAIIAQFPITNAILIELLVSILVSIGIGSFVVAWYGKK